MEASSKWRLTSEPIRATAGKGVVAMSLAAYVRGRCLRTPDWAVRHPVLVTGTEDLNIRFGYPVPTADQAPLLASYELLLSLTGSLLPVRAPGVHGQLSFEDWEITRAALVARMAGTLRHKGYSGPSSSRLDGVARARTLLEHAITFRVD
jgi:hypothetical protein